MSKSEERIKQILKEFYEQKEKNVDSIIIDRTLGIFIWGFLVGALFSYLSILPFILGIVLGIFIVRKNSFWINPIIEKFINIINNGFKNFY